MSRRTKRAWSNTMLTTNTKMKVYQACVLITPLYSSESWTLHRRKEHRLNAFHLRSIRKIMGITWQDRVPNRDVLVRAKIPSMFALLSQICLRCTHAGWLYPKRQSVGRARYWHQTNRQTVSQIQVCLQEISTIRQHSPR